VVGENKNFVGVSGGITARSRVLKGKKNRIQKKTALE
jgi:hypothetical protein